MQGAAVSRSNRRAKDRHGQLAGGPSCEPLPQPPQPRILAALRPDRSPRLLQTGAAIPDQAVAPVESLPLAVARALFWGDAAGSVRRGCCATRRCDTADRRRNLRRRRRACGVAASNAACVARGPVADGKRLTNHPRRRLAQHLLHHSRATRYGRTAVTDLAVLLDQPDTKVHAIGLNHKPARGLFFWIFPAADTGVGRHFRARMNGFSNQSFL